LEPAIPDAIRKLSEGQPDAARTGGDMSAQLTIVSRETLYPKNTTLARTDAYRGERRARASGVQEHAMDDQYEPVPAFDCIDCGRHIIALSGPRNPVRCAACMAIPGWYTDAEMRRILDPDVDPNGAPHVKH
jgi:hypothetical protein